MTVAINGVQTTDNYPQANTGGCQIPSVSLGYELDLVVGNAAAVVRLFQPDPALGPRGGQQITDEFVIVAGNGQIVQASYRGANGFEARSFVPGTPATIFATVWEKGDPVPQGGTSYAGTLTPQGSELKPVPLSSASIVRFNNGSQVIPTGVSTAIIFDNTPRVDTDGFFSAVSPDRLTIPTGLHGTYEVSGSVQWDGAPGGTVRTLTMQFDGVANHQSDGFPAAALNGIGILQKVGPIQLQLGDGEFVRLMVFQDSGVNDNITVAAGFSAVNLNIVKIG